MELKIMGTFSGRNDLLLIKNHTLKEIDYNFETKISNEDHDSVQIVKFFKFKKNKKFTECDYLKSVKDLTN